MKRKPVLSGKVAIVTGASSGIGEATARELASEGVSVVLAARREDRLDRLAKEIIASGGRALAVPTDLMEWDDIKNLVQTTLNHFGRIDILANIAGWGRYDWFEELSAEDLRMQYEVNVLGLAELTRQVVPVMKAQRSGHILNMSSYASKISVPPLTVYASTKYAVEGLTDGLRRELEPWGIEVSRIHPSGVSGTEFNRKASSQGGVRYRSFPLGKVSREQVAREIVELVKQPRRSVRLSRLYDIPVWLNRRLPELVDFITERWVVRKRKTELEAPPGPVSRPSRSLGWLVAVPVAILSLFVFVLVRVGRNL